MVNAPVPVVRAAPRERLDESRRTATVFGTHRVDLDLELLHGVDRRGHLDVLHAQAATRVVDSVDVRARRPCPTAPDRNVAVRFRPGCTRDQIDEIEDVSVGKRQFEDLLGVHGPAYRAGCRLDLQLLRTHLDNLGHRANLQRERLGDLGRDVQAQAADLSCLEPFRRSGNVVLPRRHVRHGVGAVDSSLRGRLDSCLGVDDGDLRSRDHCPGRIGNGTVDRAGRGLGEARTRIEQDKRKDGQDYPADCLHDSSKPRGLPTEPLPRLDRLCIQHR